MWKRNLLGVLSAWLGLFACDRGPSVPEGSEREARPPATTPAAPAPADDGERDAVAGLFWRVPEAFERRRPSSPMRVAEYAIPGEGGRVVAEMSVYHFPGMGGSLDANIDRWRGQFRGPDGNPPEIERETRQVGALAVTVVSMEGTYDPGPMAGSSPSGPGMRLLAAIVPRPEGPVFFKLVGQRVAIEGVAPAFDAMVAGLQAR
jgi:hypothetical protein